MRTSTFTRAARKFLAVSMAAALALGLMPALGPGLGDASRATASAAERDESAQLPVGSIASDSQDEADEAAAAVEADAPEASAQSASTHAAGSGSAGGTTVSIQVYRSSFPIVEWNLNDDDKNITKATWASSGVALPDQGTPGQAIEWEMPARYEEPTRNGFEFVGWSTNPSAPNGGYLDTSQGHAITLPEGAPEDGTYTLYALWMPRDYSVIFDLEMNPDAGTGPLAETTFELNWDTSKDSDREIIMLSAGRYRVNGFTMEEAAYDPVTHTLKLPTPARSGYRFLGWSEPAGQNVVISNPDGSYSLNPVRLTQIDGVPVLTARWTSTLGVTAPISVTFGDYDKIGVEGNPSLGQRDSFAASDTDQNKQDKEGVAGQEGYAMGGQTYFENTSWNDAIRMVAMQSVRNDNAKAVLTTYDSSKAEEADVLGGTASDGTEREGERLLSMYPSATVPSTSAERKENGVHFRLSDWLEEHELEAFSMGALGSGSERIDVSYGLNLSTDPLTGAQNHGLVLETNDYDRKPITQIAYTFSVEESYNGPVSESFWTYDDDGRRMRLNEIKRDARAIADGDATLTAKYTRWMNEDHRFYIRWYDKGIAEVDAQSEDDSTVYEVRIIGVNYDNADKEGTVKNALTFQFVDILNMDVPNAAQLYRFNNTNTNVGGWFYSELRRKMNPNNYHDTDNGDRSLDGSIYAMVPSEVKACIVGAVKRANQCAVPPTVNFAAVGWMTDRLFIASYAELVSTLPTTSVFTADVNAVYLKERPLNGSGGNILAPYPYYAQFALVGNVATDVLKKGEQRYKKADGTYTQYQYWTQRSAHPSTNIFKSTTITGEAMNASYNVASTSARGIVPCFCF